MWGAQTQRSLENFEIGDEKMPIELIKAFAIQKKASAISNVEIGKLEKKIGKKKINFRLKDWGISRQRYWGCPIPIIYDKEGVAHPVPEDTLPVKLPEKVDLNVKGNPLDYQTEWKQIEINGEKMIRETDNLDTFVC